MLLGLWLMLGVCSLSVLGSCLVPVLTYGSEMIWREKESSRIWDNLRGLPSNRRMDNVK